MSDVPQENLIDQIKIVIKDALEYLNGFLTLQQARLTAFTLTGILFFFQILFAAILGFAAFVLFNIAVGIGLSRLLNSPLLSVSILGLCYALLAWALSRRALKWLQKLKS